MTKRLHLFYNKATGDVKWLNKSQIKKANEFWLPVEFTKNDKGEAVMRIRLDNATVDISESGEKEVVTDGNTNAN